MVCHSQQHSKRFNFNKTRAKQYSNRLIYIGFVIHKTTIYRFDCQQRHRDTCIWNCPKTMMQGYIFAFCIHCMTSDVIVVIVAIVDCFSIITNNSQKPVVLSNIWHQGFVDNRRLKNWSWPNIHSTKLKMHICATIQMASNTQQAMSIETNWWQWQKMRMHMNSNDVFIMEIT